MAAVFSGSATDKWIRAGAMHSTAQPPPDSAIRATESPEGPVLTWKNPGLGAGRFVIVLFLGVWLCGWAAGEYSALQQLLSLYAPHVPRVLPAEAGPGAKPPAPPAPAPGNAMAAGFLIFWLAGWTLGGLFALAILIFMVLPMQSARLVLQAETLAYRPGSYVTQGGAPRPPGHPRLSLRHPRRWQFDKGELGAIRLERKGDATELYLEHAEGPLYIGFFLSASDKAWLAEVLRAWKAA